MATRLYLPSTGTPAISPAFGAWTSTVAADRMTAVVARISSAMTSKNGNPDTNINSSQLLRQYIYGPVGAQTLTGTVKGQARLAQNSGSAAFKLAIAISKCASDGSGVTGILAITTSATSVTSPPGAAGFTLTNRRFEEGTDDFDLDLSSTPLTSGDYLIIEIGYWDETNNTGRNGLISFGDNSATDLPEDETTTTADNPWVEFTHDIVLPSASAIAALMAGYRRRRS